MWNKIWIVVKDTFRYYWVYAFCRKMTFVRKTYLGTHGGFEAGLPVWVGTRSPWFMNLNLPQESAVILRGDTYVIVKGLGAAISRGWLVPWSNRYTATFPVESKLVTSNKAKDKFTSQFSSTCWFWKPGAKSAVFPTTTIIKEDPTIVWENIVDLGVRDGLLKNDGGDIKWVAGPAPFDHYEADPAKEAKFWEWRDEQESESEGEDEDLNRVLDPSGDQPYEETLNTLKDIVETEDPIEALLKLYSLGGGGVDIRKHLLDKHTNGEITLTGEQLAMLLESPE